MSTMAIGEDGWAIVGENGEIDSIAELNPPHNPPPEDKAGSASDGAESSLPILNVNEALRHLTEIQSLGRSMYGAHCRIVQRHVSEFAEAAAHHSAAALERAKYEAQRVLASFQGISQAPESAQSVIEAIVGQLADSGIPVFDGVDYLTWALQVEDWWLHSGNTGATVESPDGVDVVVPFSTPNMLHTTRLWSIPEVAIEVERAIPALMSEEWPHARESIHAILSQRWARISEYRRHYETVARRAARHTPAPSISVATAAVGVTRHHALANPE